MTNYTKTTDFAAKDSLPSGDSGKIIRGSEFETEFDNIATAVNSKSDANNPTFTGTVTIDGLTVNGNTILGNAATDTVTVTADIASNLIPSADDTYNLGAVGAEWNDLFIDGTANIDSLVADTADINGGTIDGVTIGGSSAGAITGTTITGTSFVTSGNMTFGDNDKAIFGAGNDLQIYHDGSNSYISDEGAGQLILKGSANIFLRSATDENYLRTTVDGSVNLYYDNAEKLATTSTGIDVTGTVTADGLTVNSGSTNLVASFESTDTTAEVTFTDTFSSSKIANNNSGLLFYTGGDASSSGANNADLSLRLAGNGDISFYEDTGTTAKFFWDASAERLGIGNSAPTTALDVTGTLKGEAVQASSANPSVTLFESDTTNLNTQLNSNFGSFRVATVSDIGGSYTQRLNVDHATGDVSLYEDTGTTAKFFWDASAERLGLGTTSPASTLHLFEANPTITFQEGAGSTTISGDAANLEYTVPSGKYHVFSGGNVGIGTSSPLDPLEVNGNIRTSIGSGGHVTAYESDGTRNNHVRVGSDSSGSFIRTSYSTGGSFDLRFLQASTERMRIDSSGNLLVSKTSFDTTNTVGTEVQADGQIKVAAGGKYPLQLNRLTSDGEIVNLRKDGTTVGSIGVGASNNLYIGSSATDHTGLVFPDNAILPAKELVTTDAFVDLGSSSKRFKDLYLSGGAYLGGVAAANKLDDYEEGEHQVALTTTTSGTITMDSAADLLQYTKIGRQVTVQGRVVVSSVSSPAGNVEVSLPFVVQNPSETSAQFTYQTVINNCVSKNVNDFVIFGGDGNTKATLAVGSATSLSLASSEIQAGSVIYFSFSYITAA